MKRRIARMILTTLVLSVCVAGAETKKLPIDLSPGAPYTGKYERGDEQVYEDPTIRVERHRIDRDSNQFGCTIYYAIITIGDASQLRTYPANGKDFCNTSRLTCEKLVKRTNAVLAIDGDYPAPFAGEQNTFVLRQGKIYRETVEEELDILLIDEDGDFHILRREENLSEIDKTQINGKKVINAFQFGPALVIDGEPVDDQILEDTTRSRVWANPQGREQRMVIAQIDTLKYMVACVAHWGASLPTMRDIAMSLAPCKVVYTLDGGESAQMIFLGTLCNNTEGKQRELADIIYFASANQ